jgi:hypothetical protein
MKLTAFHGNAQLKADLLAEVAEHRLHDQIIKGTYGEHSERDWKGCAVGCSLHSLNRRLGTQYDTSSHVSFEPAAGVPRQIAHLQDYIFERLPSPRYLDWPLRFWAAIEPGADLMMVTPKFVRWILDDTLPIVKSADIKAIYVRIIALYDRWIGGHKPSNTEWSEVYSAAVAVAAAAAAAAAAADADARYAADAAADVAAAAADARYAADALEKQADKLIELLAAAPVPSSANKKASAEQHTPEAKKK